MLQEVCGIVRKQRIVGAGRNLRKGRKKTLLPQMPDKSGQCVLRHPEPGLLGVEPLEKVVNSQRQVVESATTFLLYERAVTENAVGVSTEGALLQLPLVQLL
jgi:hypothetical protein